MGFVFNDSTYQEAIAARSRSEADRWLEVQAQRLASEREEPVERARATLRMALGYWAAAFGVDDMQRAWELYDAPIPGLGSPKRLAELTPEQLLELGERIAEARGHR